MYHLGNNESQERFLQLRKKENNTNRQHRTPFMNKALHVFIYLFLILTGAALYFTYETFLNKEEMSDRNKALRDTILEDSDYTETDVKY